MRINLNTDEAQALLDGINVVIREKARDIAMFTEALTPGPNRDEVVGPLQDELAVAKSARRKIIDVR